MSRIRGSETTPERRLREALSTAGMQFTDDRAPVGRPDLVDAARRVAVFVDGCFWHGCPDHYVRPRSREDFWSAKLTGNVARDRRQTAELVALGWTVVRVWECDVNERLPDCVERVRTAANGATQNSDRWVVVRVDGIDEASRLERRYLEAFVDPDRRRVVEGRRTTRKRGPREADPAG
jgi:DNA mismatch endonuclease (patch repair protein)